MPAAALCLASRSAWATEFPDAPFTSEADRHGHLILHIGNPEDYWILLLVALVALAIVAAAAVLIIRYVRRSGSAAADARPAAAPLDAHGIVPCLYAEAFRQSPAVTVISRVDDGVIVDVNEAFLWITGYSRDEVVGRSSLDLGLWATPTPGGVAARHGALDGSPLDFEFTFRRRNGSLVPARYSAQRIEVDGQEYIVSTMLDTTEIRSTFGIFQAMFNTSPLVCTLSTAEDGRYVMVNAAFERMFGRKAEEVIGLTSVDLGFFPSAEAREGALQELVFEGGFITKESSLHDARGQTRDVMLIGNLIDFRGVMHILTIGVDLTEQKRMQREIQQTRQLSSLGAIAGGIAHDFNTVLAIVLNNLELARFHAGATASEYIDRINEGVERGREMVQTLVDLSSGRPAPGEAVDMGTLLRQTSWIANLDEHADMGMEVEVADGLWRVRGSRSQLQQVLLHLAQNAVEGIEQARRDGRARMGEIHLGLENVSVPEEFIKPGAEHGPFKSGEFVKLTVTDNGCGIDAPAMPHIFEPSFTTKGAVHSGFGLSTVYTVVRNSGGWIDVDSTLGQGTTIALYLPRATRAPKADAAPVDAGLAVGSETVLVVEDEPLLASSMREMLELLGYSVVVATSAAEGLRVLSGRSRAVHLVIVDLSMPDGGGQSLTGRLRAVSPGLPAIVTSSRMGAPASRSPEERTVLLQKPFGLASLSTAVRRALEDGAPKAGSPMPGPRRMRYFSTSEGSVHTNRPITDPEGVYSLFSHLKSEPREKFIVLMLDARKEIIAYDEVAQGSSTETVVHPQEVLKAALRAGAEAIVLVHNHPSASPEPSAEDMVLTASIMQACTVVGVELLDHIIIARSGYCSMSREELLS
jgi:PAS domain S-box-containing protein